MISQNMNKAQSEIYLLLHNIRSVYNVGSIFRTADAVGVSNIFISGYTPSPIDRFGRVRKDISKSSLGAENAVDWEMVDDVGLFIKKLKKDKVKIIGLEQGKKSIDYKELVPAQKNLIILGEEVNGIQEGILNLCDEIVEIPMFGEKESLNVSVATGVLLYSMI